MTCLELKINTFSLIMKKNYWILIKSHSEYPDIEYEFEARNDEEAIIEAAHELHITDLKLVKENTVEVLQDGTLREL